MNRYSLKNLNGIYVFLFLFAVAFIAYWPILNNALLYDDYHHFFRISLIPASELWRVLEIQQNTFMRPLGYLLLWVIYQVFGTSPLPSHFLNVSVHAGTGFVLFLLMTRLGISRLAAFLAATLFVLSPISPGAVTWIAARFDLLALFFMLLALFLYLVSIQRKSRAAYAASMVAVAASLLSKENAMILIILIPSIEILSVSAPQESAGSMKWHLTARSWGSVARLSIFFAIFSVYFVFRYFWIGGLGGYSDGPVFGLAGIKSSALSIMVFLAPFDRLVFSRSVTILIAIYIGLLCFASFSLVIFRWKHASKLLQRAWLLMAIFFVSTFLPVWFAFSKGFDFYLQDSRFYYCSTCALIALIVAGLLDFGWSRKSWRIASSIAVILLVPVYFWGLRENNSVWEHAAAVVSYIPEETSRLVPDPPYGAKFYFQNLPRGIGSHSFGDELPEAIMMEYGKQMQPDFNTNPENREIQVFYLDPNLSPETYPAEVRNDSSDGYLFVFDWDSEQLSLEHEPR